MPWGCFHYPTRCCLYLFRQSRWHKKCRLLGDHLTPYLKFERCKVNDLFCNFQIFRQIFCKLFNFCRFSGISWIWIATVVTVRRVVYIADMLGRIFQIPALGVASMRPICRHKVGAISSPSPCRLWQRNGCPSRSVRIVCPSIRRPVSLLFGVAP